MIHENPDWYPPFAAAFEAEGVDHEPWLLGTGVSPGDLVCLSGEKSPDTFAAMIACLKVGAAYSVLDPDSPAERLRKIVSACEPSLLLGAPDFLELFGEPCQRVRTAPNPDAAEQEPNGHRRSA